MKYALGNMLNGAGGLNPDGLSLDLQFATDKTLTARKGPTPVLTRASTATFVGSDGLIQSAAIDAARFDHNPITLACNGLLVEESRTNICLQSNAFSTSPWGNVNSACAISQNQTGVDGIANSAWTFTDDSAVNIEGRFTTATLTSGVACSYSIFVKKTTGTPSTYPAIWLARGSVLGGCVINTTAGTATPITVSGASTIISTTTSVVDFGNFWRVTSFITPNVTGSWQITILPSGNGTGTGVIDGTTTGSAVFWGAQLEAGTFATSYIPTTTASVIRSADVCSISSSDFTGFWNQGAGTLVETFEASHNTNTTYVSASNGNIVQNSVHLDNDAGLMRAAYYSGSSLVATLDLGSVGTVGTVNTIATAYSVNDFAASRNGGTVVTDTSGAVPASLSQINIGTDERSQTPTSFYSNRCIKSLRYYKKRLPNAKLQSLTV